MIELEDIKQIQEVSNVELAYAEVRRVEQVIDRQLVLLLGSGVSRDIHLKIPKVKIDQRVILLLVESRYAKGGWNVRTVGDDLIYFMSPHPSMTSNDRKTGNGSQSANVSDSAERGAGLGATPCSPIRRRRKKSPWIVRKAGRFKWFLIEYLLRRI